MRRNATRLLAVAFICSQIFARPELFGQASRPATSLAQTIATTLAIHGQTDYLPALKAAVTASARDPKGFPAALDQLIDALLEGTSNPDSFSELQASQDGIANSGLFLSQKWSYGFRNVRSELFEQMWIQAKLHAVSDPVKAARYAKAALLFAAYDEYAFGEMCLMKVYAEWDALIKIIGLNPEQAAALHKTLSPLKAYCEARSIGDRDVIAIEAELLSHDGPLTADLVQKEISALIAQNRLIDGLPGEHLGQKNVLIYITWKLRNLVQKRGDDAAKRAVDDLLKSWLAKSRNQTMSRWLKEALSEVGEPFDGPRIINVK